MYWISISELDVFCQMTFSQMTFSLWFIFLINVDQLFPTLQVVDIYTQLSTGYLYASNRVPISGYHGHNGEQFAQWCTSWLHSPAATSSWSLGRRIRDWVSTPTYIHFSKQVSKDNDPKPSSKLYCSSIVVNPHLLLSPNSRDQSAGWVSVCQVNLLMEILTASLQLSSSPVIGTFNSTLSKKSETLSKYSSNQKI